MSFRQRPLLTGACALLAGCAAVAEDPRWFEDSAELHLRELAELPPAPGVASAIEAGAGRGELRPGDQVTYALALISAGDRRSWVVDVTVLDWSEMGDAPRATFRCATTINGVRHDLTSRAGPGRERVFDGDGELASDGTSQFPEQYLVRGFWRGCALCHALEKQPPAPGEQVELTDEQRADLAQLLATPMALMEVIDGVEGLAPIVWAVTRIPLSALFSRSVNLAVGLDRVERLDLPLKGLDVPKPYYRFPVVIGLNDSVALEASVVVARCDAPWSLGAGIVSLVGLRPGEPGTYFVMRLVGARTG